MESYEERISKYDMNTEEINLSGLNLTEFPVDILRYVKTKELNLSGNLIKDIPF